VNSNESALIVGAVLIAAGLIACVWLDRHPYPAPRRGPGLSPHKPMPMPWDDDWMNVADATREPRPPCTDCTSEWLCRVHDNAYWLALAAVEGLGA
jgi:hypothetical protein